MSSTRFKNGGSGMTSGTSMARGQQQGGRGSSSSNNRSGSSSRGGSSRGGRSSTRNNREGGNSSGGSYNDDYNFVQGAVSNAMNIPEFIPELSEHITNFIQKHERRGNITPQDKEDFFLSLHEMNNGKHFDERTAEKLVNELPEGEKWPEEETSSIMEELRVEPEGKFTEWDWYVKMNLLYNLYNKVHGEDPTIYGKMAEAYFCEEDAEPGKLWHEQKHRIMSSKED